LNVHVCYLYIVVYLLLSGVQVFVSDGKILQFRTDSVESQAHWMAALKVGLGRGQYPSQATYMHALHFTSPYTCMYTYQCFLYIQMNSVQYPVG